MWIYIPLPGGSIMPMIASVFACSVVSPPDNAVKHAGYGTLVWGGVFTTQYALLLPIFTEIWQLVALLFISSSCVLLISSIFLQGFSLSMLFLEDCIELL
jgi:hypothetical protein